VKVLYVADGQPAIRRVEKWRALGLCAKMTKHQAEREKDRLMREVNNQVYTIQSQMRFAVVLASFREHHIPTLAEPSQATYLQHIRAYIGPAFGDLRLCDIGVIQIEQLFRGMELAGLSRGTRNTTKGILRSIFGCAKRWGCIDSESPVKAASVGGGPRHVRQCRVPSFDDVSRLMAECEGDVPLLIEALYTTGMRISEAAGLTVADLDFGTGLAWIRRRNCRGSIGETKSEAGTRAVGLGDAADKLRAHVASKRPSDPVFTWQGEPIIDNQLLAGYVTPIMVRLGIKFPGFGWHAFRRLHLSLMSRRGLTIFDLRRQAGHADVRTTQRYIADDVARRADAAKGLFVVQNA
jgi:integrase